MRTGKRKADDSIGPEATRRPRVGSLDPKNDDEHGSAFHDLPSANEFKVEIRLRSASKAKINDPKPADWRHRQLSTAEDSGNSGSSVTSEVAGTRGLASTGRETGRHVSVDRKIGELGLSEISSEEEPEDYGSEDESDRSEFDEFAEFDWLEAMDGLVTFTRDRLGDSTEHNIGYCHGKLIRRDEIRTAFYHKMEEPSHETSLLAFDIFDRYGRLRSEVKDHAVRKGSGVWNDELDCGDILLIEHIQVKKEYRHQGFGKKLAKSMIDKARSKSTMLFAIVRPDFLNRDVEAEMEVLSEQSDKDQVQLRAEATAISFWRSVGFRRIGSAPWFGLAFENDHPSHRLAVEDDYNPPSPSKTADLELKPLQRALEQSPDEECFTSLSNYLLKTPATDLSWRGVDAQGNTLLHLASKNLKAASVEWIMKQEFGPKMLEKRNHEGDVPLEAATFELEDMRIRKVYGELTTPTSDMFTGHSDAAVRVLIALKGLTTPTDLDLARLASGCTCGQCVAGFISPRMCFTLLRQAEMQCEILSLPSEQDSGPDFVYDHKRELQYLPQRVRENLKTNKSMRQGFVSICRHIATCLREKIAPDAIGVLNALGGAGEWPPVTKNFLQRGGTIESVALMIFHTAMDQDELAGDGLHKKVYGDDIAKLPECRNDHEFGFVSGMCGYKRISQIR